MYFATKWFSVNIIAIGFISCLICLFPVSYVFAEVVDYDIVYVRMPRSGDNTHMKWAEVHTPVHMEPGSDLMLLHPDGNEELLYDAGSVGAVADPFVSFDGKKVYFSYFEDAADTIKVTTGVYAPRKGADIYVIDVATRVVKRLTFQEFIPNTGAGNWKCTGSGSDTQCDSAIDQQVGNEFHSLGYGVFNTAPVPLAGGKIMFTSNRNGFHPPKTYTNITFQLFVMDEDGSNVTPISPMTIGSALHPVPLKNGQVMFSSYESQGLRDERLWGVWSINPDGRQWKPLISSFLHPQVLHFSTQLSNGDIVIEDYYNFFNFGFGALYKFPFPASNQPAFYSASATDPANPAIVSTIPSVTYDAASDHYPGEIKEKKLAFAPKGIESITPFTMGEDYSAPIGADGMRVGKFTHPSSAPNNHLLVVWSPGPVNDNSGGRPSDIPAVDAGLYLIRDGSVISSPADSKFVSIKNDPQYNEIWPRAVVSYQAIYGQSEPDQIEWLPDNTEYADLLPPGTPYGLIGTSSFYNRESFPGFDEKVKSFDGLDSFNALNVGGAFADNSNWIYQGSDAGKYDNSDIWAVRIVSLEANTRRRYGPYNQGGIEGTGTHFFNLASEKMRILGEIPLRKFNADGTPVFDPKGDPDTSFLAKISADTPFTFQMLDRNGMVLTTAQTWHQVRPGEARHDCGGCHAHSQQPVLFEQTAAAHPSYQVADLTKTTPLLSRSSPNQEPAITQVQSNSVNVEFYKDIRPILQQHCVQCHSGSLPPGNLKLDDHSIQPLEAMPHNEHTVALEGDGTKEVPEDYKRLCNDPNAQWGYKPLVGKWAFPNASRYVRAFQSRRSLLAWKVFGERLDGWTNADHPTETIPGDVSTYPEGSSNDAKNRADLDFTGTIMPPPNNTVGAAPLSEDQKMTIARWIDFGCPIDTAQQKATNNNYGWYLDDQRPTLHVSLPKAGNSETPINLIRIGIADAYKGIQAGSLKISASIEMNGQAADTELGDLFTQSENGIYTMTVSPPLTDVTNAELYVEVADNQTEINPDGNITRVKRTFSVNTNDPGVDPDPDNPSASVDFETAGDELQLVGLDGKTYNRIAGHGGQVLRVPSNNHSSLLRFRPNGSDYSFATGTVSVDLNPAYFGGDQHVGSLGSSMGLLLKRWSDADKTTSTNPNGFSNYSVSVQPIGGNLVVQIGASKANTFAGPAYTYYNEAEGHSTRLKTNITSYNAVVDNQNHSLGWWNLSATLLENSSGAIEIRVELTSPNGQQFTETWVDNGTKATLISGLVGIAAHSKWSAGLDFDNFSVSNGNNPASNVISVGPGQTYATPSALAAANILQPGDVVEIQAGLYPADVAVWNTDNITLKGIGGMAHLRADGASAQGKGIWIINGDNTIVENIEFSGATVADQNGAGIRHQTGHLTVRNSYFHDNENGILTNNHPEAELIIEGSEFFNNGFGDGQTHNIYAGRIKKFTLRNSYIHHTHFGSDAGHNVKSRAQENFILYNRIMDEVDGRASRQIDLSNGGRSYLIGNLIQQGVNASNSNLVGYAKEGASNLIQELYIVNNTFVNERFNGSFIDFNGNPQLKIVNNIFIGAGNVPTGNDVDNNLVTNNAGLVNQAGFDYHLVNNSSAINQGVDPDVSSSGFNLIPDREYQHIAQDNARPVDTALDIGAYEFE